LFVWYFEFALKSLFPEKKSKRMLFNKEIEIMNFIKNRNAFINFSKILYAVLIGVGFTLGSAYATPVLISGITIDAKQTYYDNSNGTLAPEILLPAGATQLIFSFHGGIITDGSNQLGSADGLYSNGQTPYNFTNTTYGTGTYMGVPIGGTTGIDPAIFGVFFDPTFSGIPANSFDYRSDNGISPDPRTLLSYSPSLNQPFWIGDGYNQNTPYNSSMQNSTYVPPGIQQIYNIPTGAAYLLLGIGADINMADNQFGAGQTQFTGAQSVPEPPTMLLVGLSLMGLVGVRKKFKK
jgi:hypothetical protein